MERFHRTPLDEHLTVKGWTTWYEPVDETQADPDAHIETYNRNRPHGGRDKEERTPYQTFERGSRKPQSRTKSAKTKLTTPPQPPASAKARVNRLPH